MKILIIAENIGRTAPGIVFERLTDGLSNNHKVDLFVNNFSPSKDLGHLNKIIVKNKIKLHPRVFKFLIGLFGINPIDYLWSLNNTKKIVDEYDLILGFCSYHHYLPMISGVLLKDKLKSKLAIYCVDGLPAPAVWPDNEFYRKGVKRMMMKYAKLFDAIFSSNYKMLEYQKQFLRLETNILKGVVYTPSFSLKNELPERMDSDCYNFVYTGGIYGVRKVDYILEAFERLIKEIPNCRLIFVGSKLEQGKLDLLDSYTREKVIIEPYTNDLIKFYIKATALLDIDADVEDDIFLSSKITNYIMYNRFIICETGRNSPSRKLFEKIDSIIQCDHDVEELYEAMKYTIRNNKGIDFSDREDVIELFKLKNIVAKLESELQLIC